MYSENSFVLSSSSRAKKRVIDVSSYLGKESQIPRNCLWFVYLPFKGHYIRYYTTPFVFIPTYFLTKKIKQETKVSQNSGWYVASNDILISLKSRRYSILRNCLDLCIVRLVILKGLLRNNYVDLYVQSRTLPS